MFGTEELEQIALSIDEAISKSKKASALWKRKRREINMLGLTEKQMEGLTQILEM